MTIIEMTATVFVTQFVFTWGRTWNIKAIADRDVKRVLISGTIVYFCWLLSIALGSISVIELVQNFNTDYIPVIIAGLVGGNLGGIVKLKN